MKKQSWLTRALIAITAFALCGVPEATCVFAQEAAQPATTQQDATQPAATPQTVFTQPQDATTQQQSAAQQPTTTTPQQKPRGTNIDPSQGPLTPVPTQMPDATNPEQNQVQQPSPAPQNTTPATAKPREPLGAAAAEGVRTEGGGASRPGGIAIAPAKQRQVRSLLLKMGFIAAAGVAVGTVYALSRGTSSTPPNSGR